MQHSAYEHYIHHVHGLHGGAFAHAQENAGDSRLRPTFHFPLGIGPPFLNGFYETRWHWHFSDTGLFFLGWFGGGLVIWAYFLFFCVSENLDVSWDSQVSESY